jgi:phosphate starvation-inducible protein PhoH and related proteins
MKIKLHIPSGIDPVIAFGVHDSNLRLLERVLAVKILPVEEDISIEGDEDNITRTSNILSSIFVLARGAMPISHNDIKILIEEGSNNGIYRSEKFASDGLAVSRKGYRLKPRTSHQKEYIRDILDNDLTFAAGPAGTGKTYIAVGMALHMLNIGRVKKIILTRPVVEAGENLGFLPGTIEEKIDPYLRPLFDALKDMLGPEELKYMMENQVIELAPLAYMRGRTLSNSFIILDEAQNTTAMQMKMCLTRLGENSKMAVTGDITQIDLPSGRESGLKQALELFQEVEGIKFIYFNQTDVLRHGLVKKILEIYEKSEKDSWKELPAR